MTRAKTKWNKFKIFSARSLLFIFLFQSELILADKSASSQKIMEKHIVENFSVSPLGRWNCESWWWSKNKGHKCEEKLFEMVWTPKTSQEDKSGSMSIKAWPARRKKGGPGYLKLDSPDFPSPSSAQTQLAFDLNVTTGKGRVKIWIFGAKGGYLHTVTEFSKTNGWQERVFDKEEFAWSGKKRGIPRPQWTDNKKIVFIIQGELDFCIDNIRWQKPIVKRTDGLNLSGEIAKNCAFYDFVTGKSKNMEIIPTGIGKVTDTVKNGSRCLIVNSGKDNFRRRRLFFDISDDFLKGKQDIIVCLEYLDSGIQKLHIGAQGVDCSINKANSGQWQESVFILNGVNLNGSIGTQQTVRFKSAPKAADLMITCMQLPHADETIYLRGIIVRKLEGFLKTAFEIYEMSLDQLAVEYTKCLIANARLEFKVREIQRAGNISGLASDIALREIVDNIKIYDRRIKMLLNAWRKSRRIGLASLVKGLEPPDLKRLSMQAEKILLDLNSDLALLEARAAKINQTARNKHIFRSFYFPYESIKSPISPSKLFNKNNFGKCFLFGPTSFDEDTPSEVYHLMGFDLMRNTLGLWNPSLWFYTQSGNSNIPRYKKKLETYRKRNLKIFSCSYMGWTQFFAPGWFRKKYGNDSAAFDYTGNADMLSINLWHEPTREMCIIL